MKFPVKTPKQNFDVEVFYKFIKKGKVPENKNYFDEFCKKGCKNFGKKYSCPPFAPSFSSLCNKEGIFVVLFKVNLGQINSTPYNKIRIANVVMKSRLDRIMRKLEEKFCTKYFSTGSCRLCRICGAKKNSPCKYPDKKRYSLEATGVDCNQLSKKLFDTELQWFAKKKTVDYTCVMCGLICDESEKEKIEEELLKHS